MMRDIIVSGFSLKHQSIYARRAEPEPPVTMMLSHFSGGNPEYIHVVCYLSKDFSGEMFIFHNKCNRNTRMSRLL